jgi:hypothetical protein
MIRPIFGQGEITTALPEVTNSFALYPNPVADQTFFINRPVEVIAVYSINGQAIDFTTHYTANNTQITLNQNIRGLALVKMKINNEIVVRKIMIQ